MMVWYIVKTGDEYGRIAGRRECAIVDVVFGIMVVTADGTDGGVLGGERRERSSMKFPASTLEGVRGRYISRLMSYGWLDVRAEVSSCVCAYGWS